MDLIRTKSWKTELTEIDELFGREPRYQLAAVEEYIQYEIGNQNKIIQQSSNNVKLEIENSTNEICGSLENGFKSLIQSNSKNLNDISSSLNNMNETLIGIGQIIGWKLNRLIEQVKTSNILLENIAELLKISEIEKESEFYIREGLKHFNNSQFDKSLFDNAFLNFKKAEKLIPTNYFLLQKIGLIYFYSVKHLDIDLAIKYFIKAAKFSSVELNTGSKKTSTILKSNINKKINSQITNEVSISNQTFISYVYLSECYYLSNELNKSIEFIDKALKLKPQDLEARFNKAKYLAINLETKKSITIFENLLNENKFIALRIIKDKELITNKEIRLFLNKMTNKSIQLLKSKIILFKTKTSNGKLNHIIKQSNKLLSQENFIDAKKGIEIIELKQSFKFDKITRIDGRINLYRIDNVNFITYPIKLYNYLVYTDNKKALLEEYYKFYESNKVSLNVKPIIKKKTFFERIGIISNNEKDNKVGLIKKKQEEYISKINEIELTELNNIL